MAEKSLEEVSEVPESQLIEVSFPEGYDHIDAHGYDFKNCPTRVDRTGPYFIDDVLAAIAVAAGNLNRAAYLLRRSRVRLKDYVYRTDAAIEFLDNFQEGLLDYVEASHNRAALAGDGSAQRFLLSTLGKQRGYSTKTETKVEHGVQEHVHTINLVAPNTKVIPAAEPVLIENE